MAASAASIAAWISRRCFSAASISSILDCRSFELRSLSSAAAVCFSCSSLCSRRSASSFSESSACAASLRASCCRAATVWSRSFASSVRADASAFCCAASFTAPPSCLRSAATFASEGVAWKSQPRPGADSSSLHRAASALRCCTSERTATCSRCCASIRSSTRCAASARREDCSESCACACSSASDASMDIVDYSSVPEGGVRTRITGCCAIVRLAWLCRPRNCSAAARICGPNSPWCAGAAVAAHPTQSPPTSRAGEVSAFQDRPPPRRAALRLRLCAARKFFALSRRRALPSAGSALAAAQPQARR